MAQFNDGQRAIGLMSMRQNMEEEKNSAAAPGGGNPSMYDMGFSASDKAGGQDGMYQTDYQMQQQMMAGGQPPIAA